MGRGWLLALMACGQGTASSSQQSAQLPGECSVRCERAKPQLTQNFGVTQVDCWDPELFFADGPGECDGVFMRRWGVTFTAPPSP